jgi:hypothetical protein
MNKKLTFLLTVTILLIATLAYAAPVRATPSIVNVSFYSTATGYACFASQEVVGPVICLSSNIASLNATAAMPVGNYTVVFYPIDSIDGYTIWLVSQYPLYQTSINSLTPFDPSASTVTANVTIGGDATIIVYALPYV